MKDNMWLAVTLMFIIIFSVMIMAYVFNRIYEHNKKHDCKEGEEWFVNVLNKSDSHCLTTTNTDDLNDWKICRYRGFKIEYVDEALTENCYALINKDVRSGYYEYLLNLSINNPYEEAMKKFIEEDRCNEFTATQTIYCLRNLTKCLLIEDNKICRLIEVK